jgi:chemotaxis response regulator CheB
LAFPNLREAFDTTDQQERITRDIMTIGASAGGIPALRRLFAALPHASQVSSPSGFIEAGGLAIAQDPSEAASPGMPESAIWLNHVDIVLPIAETATALVTLASGDPSPSDDA